jgi:hypothetical protein
MNSTMQTIQGIDWELLRKQKRHLLLLPYHTHTQGIIHFIDAIQDAAIADGIASEEEVFSYLPSLLEAMVETMKREILEDIEAELVPDHVASFSKLHDYVDANCYGGLCNDGAYGRMLDDHFDGVHQDFIDFINQAQCEVDEWLSTRREEKHG